MNLLEQYTPAELALKTIEDIEKRREKEIKAEKEFTQFVQNRYRNNLNRKNKKRFYR